MLFCLLAGLVVPLPLVRTLELPLPEVLVLVLPPRTDSVSWTAPSFTWRLTPPAVVERVVVVVVLLPLLV